MVKRHVVTAFDFNNRPFLITCIDLPPFCCFSCEFCGDNLSAMGAVESC